MPYPLVILSVKTPGTTIFSVGRLETTILSLGFGV